MTAREAARQQSVECGGWRDGYAGYSHPPYCRMPPQNQTPANANEPSQRGHADCSVAMGTIPLLQLG